MKNKLIIIGNDHTNTLGIIRTFGENGIRPYIIIISDTRFIAVKKSKYVEKYYICANEEEAMLVMEEKFSDEKLKPVVIPTSDKIMAILDNNYNRLSESFILHNINNEENKINYYMDKYHQYKLSLNNNITMAKSMILDFPFKKLVNIDFPLIIKPLVSAKGEKNDITICSNANELEKALEIFREKNYNQILIQEYIFYNHEYDISGFAYQGNVYIPGIVKKERIWPIKTGSTTFGVVEDFNSLEIEIDKIKSMLKSINYNGIFDIDFFIKDNVFYLNEINFRNGALSYCYGNKYIAYYWYLSCINNKFESSEIINKKYFFIDDQADLHNVIDRNITLKQYLNDKKSSKILLSSNKLDKKPSRFMLMYKVLDKIKLKKILLLIDKSFHKCPATYLLVQNKNDIKSHFNKDYNIIKINSKNTDLLVNDLKQVKKDIVKNHANAIIIERNKKFVGMGVIKKRGCSDKFIKIKNSNSFLITNIYVVPKYRGKNYQCDIISELINAFIPNENYKLYAVIYKYNLPSIKNFKKLGFEIEKEWKLIRLLKKSINKESI